VQAAQFGAIHLGDVLAVATVVVGVLALRFDFNKRTDEQKKERDKWLQAQTQMHTENQMRLESLMTFQTAQTRVNHMRDEQVSQLKQQTAAILEICKAMDRRVQMLEDRN